ncbi:MAG: 50S ribosomal protein L22 [Verrucomicrobiota bacterium]|nr:50S ribosomal protein L22 [Verrucomicrobiota bacterium]
MEVQAITRNTRISPYKARHITRAIQGKSATVAQEMLKFIPRKAARLIIKTLNSAVANAENNFNLSSRDLIVHRALIEEGPAFRRFVPAPRGMAHPIKKRTSHIRIVLSDEAKS